MAPWPTLRSRTLGTTTISMAGRSSQRWRSWCSITWSTTGSSRRRTETSSSSSTHSTVPTPPQKGEWEWYACVGERASVHERETWSIGCARPPDLFHWFEWLLVLDFSVLGRLNIQSLSNMSEVLHATKICNLYQNFARVTVLMKIHAFLIKLWTFFGSLIYLNLHYSLVSTRKFLHSTTI